MMIWFHQMNNVKKIYFTWSSSNVINKMNDCKTVPVCELIQENPHLSLKSKMNNKQHLNFLFRVLKYFLLWMSLEYQPSPNIWKVQWSQAKRGKSVKFEVWIWNIKEVILTSVGKGRWHFQLQLSFKQAIGQLSIGRKACCVVC